MAFGFKHWWTVGIWLNHKEQLVALRLHRDSWKKVTVPFSEIQSVQIFEEEREITEVRGFLLFVRTNTDEISKGLKIKINTVTRDYYLKLWDPMYGTKLKKSNSQYTKIQECAWSIVDEIGNIIRNY